ncbi:MAG: hypothetical protein AB7V45_10935 [Candidatus Krumholzibacteriia bacterium]
MKKRSVVMTPVTILFLAVLAAGGAALADPGSSGRERAAWLMSREALEFQALTGLQYDQGEFGGGAADPVVIETEGTRSGSMTGLHILASLILPGSGEAMLGHKRGYVMMAADIFAWTQVAKYDKDGKDLEEEFFAFADEHWSEDRLVAAYNAFSDDEYIGGLGLDYFPDVESVSDAAGLEGNLPLWVSVEADRWEYYENLGKWDQFVFGWDDFVSPYDTARNGGYVADPPNLDDLRQPWTSANRDLYREMRGESDDAFKKRDRWLYVNIGLRVFSVVQTAYFEGLLGGGPARDLKVGGHAVNFSAHPVGLSGGVVSAAVSF